MDPVWLLILLPAAAASGWLAARAASFRRTERDHLSSVYLRGINFLINDQHDKAIEMFLGMLEADSETIEIHLALGSLFRRRGEIARATRIHENLIVRNDLTGEQRMQALFELGQDYYVAGLFDRAERFFGDLKRDSKHREPALEYLRCIYEQEKEWGSCIDVTRTLNRISSQGYHSILSQYHCELAEVAITEGRYEEAEKYIEDAIKIDRNCIRAILQSGRLKVIHGDHQSAVDTWRMIEHKQPQYVSEIVGLVTASYRTLGRSEELEEFLRMNAELINDAQLAIAYVDALESRQGREPAERFLTDWIRRNPSLQSLHRLILLKLRGNAHDSSNQQDFQLLEKMIGRAIEADIRYECQRCGFTVRNLHWQCPGCRSWNTIQCIKHRELASDSVALEAEM